MQARTACLSTMTVHEPQRAWPQPNLVPVRPTSSRINHSSGRSGSPSQFNSWPLTFTLIMIASPSSYRAVVHFFEVSENIYPGHPLVRSQAKLTSLRNCRLHRKDLIDCLVGPILLFCFRFVQGMDV